MDKAVLLQETKAEISDKRLEDKFSRLVRLQQLQKSIVRQNMHNAMSPLSAISGYLDLIGMTLEQEASVDQIEYYRKKIESGISEVNAILEQLHEVYRTENQMDEEFLEVDLNWTVRDVISHIKSSSTQIIFKDSYSPLHIKTTLYTAKLIIYKIILYAIKSSGKKQDVVLSTEKENDLAKLNVEFHVSKQKVNDINAVLDCDNPKDEFECINQSSLNEGLLASNKLTSQIGGKMKFSYNEEGKGRLMLSLPLN